MPDLFYPSVHQPPSIFGKGRTVLALLSLSFLLLASACAAQPGPATVQTPTAPGAGEQAATPTVAATAALPATPTPINLSRVDPETMKGSRRSADCGLITGTDVGGVFSAEVPQPTWGDGAAQRVIFAPEAVSTQESYCVYQAFYLSGSAKGAYYQVTLWVDKPAAAAAPGQWTQVWTDASQTGKAIPGIGDAAFYKEGRLTFKKGDTYVTVEVISDRIDASTPDGQAKQLDYEQKLALKAASRIPA